MVGPYLRQLREQQALTLRAVAERLTASDPSGSGVTYTAVGQWERGDAGISSTWLDRYLDVLVGPVEDAPDEAEAARRRDVRSYALGLSGVHGLSSVPDALPLSGATGASPSPSITGGDEPTEEVPADVKAMHLAAGWTGLRPAPGGAA